MDGISGLSNIYKLYRDRLVEISGKSRSLYSKRISAKQSYNLFKLFGGDAQEAQRFAEFLWSGNKRRYKLLTPAHLNNLAKDPANAKYTGGKLLEVQLKALRALQREIEEIERETGRYELFVGYPFLEGGIGGGITAKAPLVLFPARIILEKDAEIEILRDEPVMLNKVLILACARENRINIEELSMEFDKFHEELPDISALVNYLKQYGLQFKFPRQQIVSDFEAAKEPKSTDNPEVRTYMVLGRYPLANSIYNDYNIMVKKRLTSPAIDAILRNKDAKVKPDRNPEYYHIHQLDYAQEQAIEKINTNSNVVIYGPPGTGKSQTIANIISDAICKGKRLLVISQKRTALDVVYNRLGNLSAQAVILPDPEKSKNDFYAKARLRHSQLLGANPSFNSERLQRIDKALESELKELKTISDTLFLPTDFGPSMQEMYLMSAEIAKDSPDEAAYQAMLKSPLMDIGYKDFIEAAKSILQKNEGDLFYKHYTQSAKNPVINYIRTGLDMHTIHQVRTYIRQLMSEKTLPFNLAEYPYSRYMLVYNLESGSGDSEFAPLADMITNIEHKSLTKALKISTFPLFWLAYLFLKPAYMKKRKVILERLKVAHSGVRRYISEFDLLKSALEPDGLALVIDNITYGNSKFLEKLYSALEDYATVRSFRIAVDSLSVHEKAMLDFAFANSANKSAFKRLLGNLLPLRIYHEVVKGERKNEHGLSKLVIFNDIQNRIMALKQERLTLVQKMAADIFVKDYQDRLNIDPETTKNFLHQINKQNKLWPIRRLMQHFEAHLMDLFPCWLLSPEAVSAILPLKPDLFDLVLFDEASQIFIESSIPSIYRGKCVVVSGDSKQLRPTSVFVKRYMGDDSYNPDVSLNTQAVMEVESLLDLASSRLTPAHLTYHYRSKYEELINFSNYAFYEGRLQIAPNNSRYRGYRPIERIKVDGKWIGRRNEVEAKAVVDLVASLFKKRKNDETIGIVTFNTEQEECIEDLLDERCNHDSAFKTAYYKEIARKHNGEDVSLFVKNLENVQGDERDIIIFSTAYAYNEEGRLNAQFGTLSQPGGENRLNVAITRAKSKIYVVTSVEPEEFVTIDNAKNLGPKLFKKYLQYARAVSNGDTNEMKAILNSLLMTRNIAPRINYTGVIEQDLKFELEKKGYIVETCVGNADYTVSLAIYDKALDQYVLGLECDYAAKESSDSILERDVYRSGFLASRGWRIRRIWSRDYWHNKKALLKSIEADITKQREMLAVSKTAATTPKRTRKAKATDNA